MAFELPSSLSPSKVSSFTDCALAFRFSAIDRVPEPPSLPATRGTLVHSALELLFDHPPHERTMGVGLESLELAFQALREHPEYTGLELDGTQEEVFRAEASELLQRYFQLEDPASVHPIGLELQLEVDLDGLTLRGIIDRLELDADGELVVTDYKTGRAPSQPFEQGRLGGVHFYAFLCERLFGRRPSKVQLLYLADPVAITTTPTEQSIRALERKVRAIWSAIEKACEKEHFAPRPSKLCDWCAFQAWCPAFGGDPASVPVTARTHEDPLPSLAPAPA